ncbi:hypothetical protein [Sphingobacterium sp. T2]|uniref:hypothetical protein n=1 Tax=Sphingobacterium sp. T2 TaxID=1590596 RepID=UPI00068E1D78|nr:hypothetical protein [Sphingobacterium sp. T2]
MKLYKKTLFLIFIGSSIFGHVAFGQQITYPTRQIKDRSFAIIVDNRTYAQCKEELTLYRQVVEKEGLPTFIVSGNWSSPEQVKIEIFKLYKIHKLEGIVLIGDIPIVMVRKGQHLATAFKMDENLDIRESSIPSDRFYDDFDLTFDFIKKDEKDSLLFYYNLGINSANKIQSEIYSARIKPIAAEGKNSYQQISHYLKKVITAHTENNRISNVLTYLGDGTLSNSLAAWTPELYRLEEQFPNTFKSGKQAQSFRFDSWNYPKDELINQFRRKDLDIAFIHEHGMPEHMFISGDIPSQYLEEHFQALQYSLKKLAGRLINDSKAQEKFYDTYVSKYNLAPSILDGYDSRDFKEQDSLRNNRQGIVVTEVDEIKPNVRLTIFDACYNGDFREKDYIAGRFIFSQGKALVALANSVSILQDVNTTHLIGTLGMGVSVGKWAQQNYVLESHLIGDPTFTFAKNSGEDWSWVFREKNNRKLVAALRKAQKADARNIIFTQLYKNNFAGLPKLLAKEYHQSNYVTTRYTCLHLANLIGGDFQLNMLKRSCKDSDEFIRRHSINTMSKVGHPSLLPYILEAYIENQQASRVLFSIKMSLYSFNQKLIKEEAEKVFAQAPVVDKTKFKEKFYDDQFQGFYQNLDSIIFDSKNSLRTLAISSLKNVNYHPSVDKYLTMVKDNKEDVTMRIAMLQSLAWFGQSYRKMEILQACEEIANATDIPEEVKTQALRTLNILK